jgi:hypothetical protein
MKLLDEASECTHDEGHNFIYIEGSTDSRDEWSEESNQCEHCGLIQTIRVYYDDDGPYSREIYYEGLE